MRRLFPSLHGYEGSWLRGDLIAGLTEALAYASIAGVSPVVGLQRQDFLAAITAMLGVLVFDTLPGLFIGIGVSLLLLLYRASRPHVASLGQQRGRGPFVDLRRHPGYAPPDGIAVLRIEGGLFFANADAIRARVRAEAAGKRAVVLDAETVPGVDVTAAEMLANLAADLQRPAWSC